MILTTGEKLMVWNWKVFEKLIIDNGINLRENQFCQIDGH